MQTFVFTLLVLFHNPETDFDRFRSLLPKISLPYSMWCGYQGSGITAPEIPKDLLKFQRRFGAAAELPLRNNVVPVLFFDVGDILYPYLYTFDKIGNVIDSLRLDTNGCFGDGGYIQTAHVIIDKSFAITIRDTLRISPEDEGSTLGDSLVVFVKQFTILESGEFKLLNDNINAKRLPK